MINFAKKAVAFSLGTAFVTAVYVSLALNALARKEPIFDPIDF